jgi:hypothetical protein
MIVFKEYTITQIRYLITFRLFWGFARMWTNDKQICMKGGFHENIGGITHELKRLICLHTSTPKNKEVSMKRFKNRRFGMAMVALALALAAFTIPNATAYACYGNSCRGLDPIAQGCSSDAHNANYATGYKAGVGTILVELRHSNVCRAFWSKATSQSGSRYMLGYIIELDTAYHYWYPTTSYSMYTSQLYTDMVSGTVNDVGFAHGYMATYYFQGPVQESWAYAGAYGH